MSFSKIIVKVSNALLMKSTALSLLLLLTINQSFAENMLDQINKQLPKAELTQGKFEQSKSLKFLTKPLISKGKFTFDKKKGVIWQTLTPLQSTLIIGDNGILSGEDKPTMPPTFGKVFKALLGGEIDKLSQNFTIIDKQQAQSWTLELKPKDDMLKKVINTITISGDSEVRDWELQETGGNLTRIHFSEITHPERLKSEQQTDFERLLP